MKCSSVDLTVSINDLLAALVNKGSGKLLKYNFNKLATQNTSLS